MWAKPISTVRTLRPLSLKTHSVRAGTTTSIRILTPTTPTHREQITDNGYTELPDGCNSTQCKGCGSKGRHQLRDRRLRRTELRRCGQSRWSEYRHDHRSL